MVSGVGIVRKLMKALSSKEPSMFQRNGKLYFVSEEGFGVVCGIPLFDTKEKSTEEYRAEDLISKTTGNLASRKVVLKRGEHKYLQAMMFGRADDSFSLGDVVKSAPELHEVDALRKDGRVRIIKFYDRSSNGGDIKLPRKLSEFLTQAFAMGEEDYFHLVGNREDWIFRKIRRSVEKGGLTENYQKLPELLRFLVMTPNLLVTFPTEGNLSVFGDEPNSWTTETRFRVDGLLGKVLVSERDLGRFARPYLAVNEWKGEDDDFTGVGYEGRLVDRVNGVNEELGAVDSVFAEMEGLGKRYNSLRSKLYARGKSRE